MIIIKIYRDLSVNERYYIVKDIVLKTTPIVTEKRALNLSILLDIDNFYKKVNIDKELLEVKIVSNILEIFTFIAKDSKLFMSDGFRFEQIKLVFLGDIKEIIAYINFIKEYVFYNRIGLVGHFKLTPLRASLLYQLEVLYNKCAEITFIHSQGEEKLYIIITRYTSPRVIEEYMKFNHIIETSNCYYLNLRNKKSESS